MGMSSNDLISCLAQDFSWYLTEVLGLEDMPANAFYDPVVAVFGDAPSEQSIIAVFRSSNGAARLSRELNSWLETDQVSIAMAANRLEVSIVNNFGSEIVESESPKRRMKK